MCPDLATLNGQIQMELGLLTVAVLFGVLVGWFVQIVWVR